MSSLSMNATEMPRHVPRSVKCSYIQPSLQWIYAVIHPNTELTDCFLVDKNFFWLHLYNVPLYKVDPTGPSKKMFLEVLSFLGAQG